MSGKAAHLFHLLDEHDTVGRALTYGKVKAHSIGGIYTIQADDETAGTVYPSTILYTGDRLDDHEAVTLWQVKDEAEGGELDAVKAEKRLGKRPELDSAVRPVLVIASNLRTSGDVAALQRLVAARIAQAYWTREVPR
jgi:hypothetical protein